MIESNYLRKREIEVETRNQSLDEKWFDVRHQMVTASNFGKICKVKSLASYHNIILHILYTRVSNCNMLWGLQNEKKAIQKLEEAIKIKVQKCGFFIDDEFHYLGATPDGLVGEDGICEVKCPSSIKNLTISDAVEKKKLKYLQKSGDTFVLKKNDDYFYQVQGQLHITKRSHCFFGVWTSCDFVCIKIQKDDSFWEDKIKNKLLNFYNNHFLLELCDPRIPRKMRVWNT
ncbi:uncharacterized protein LOC129907141 [Episyrphus balteatus]|uniref:uncharacterized protein LOC129907141 n=1 Tax=Episyrphus balteatus TaxID=286459 RepID=UPI0024857496|nr:uncharacterized protein LOC129907141 [Episyrphus balteatus]